MNVRGILTGSGKLVGIGTYKIGRQFRLLFLRKTNKTTLTSAESSDGVSFKEAGDFKIKDRRGRTINIQNLSSIRIANVGNKLISIYKVSKGLVASVFVGREDSPISISTVGRIPQISETAAVVPDYKFKGKYVAYSGGRNLKILTSDNLTKWWINKKVLLTVDRDSEIEIGTVEKIKQGILIIYFEAKQTGIEKFFYSIKAAIFDEQNPEKIVFKTKEPIWETPSEWNDLRPKVKPFGLLIQGEKLISYWELNESEIIAVVHEKRAKLHEGKIRPPEILLTKHHENPILQPNPSNFWESKATFNPAAIYDEGRVHLLYRAIGDHDMSMLGYASSRDGVHIDVRLKDPVYVPTQPFEFSPKTGQSAKSGNNPPLSPYASGGGGSGGVEDPRLTKIGRRIFMTYVAYDGMGPPRVALTSIGVADFRKKNWKWGTPVVISKPGIVDKNAVIFPEQIAGKYCIMHRVFPDILIDYVDSLDFDGKTYLPGAHKIEPRNFYWDSRKIGAGAPPIKTDAGWLLIYQAVGNDDPSRYKIGAMLLDLDDPSVILARSDRPILEPSEDYENEGYKYGVVYPCGAVTINDELFVYYGGADMVSCVAKTNLDSFLNDLSYHHVGALEQVQL